MNKGKFVSPQLLDFLDCKAFNIQARKDGCNKYVKQCTCYNQLEVLMCKQFSYYKSLSDIVLATQTYTSKTYHIGPLCKT